MKSSAAVAALGLAVLALFGAPDASRAAVYRADFTVDFRPPATKTHDFTGSILEGTLDLYFQPLAGIGGAVPLVWPCCAIFFVPVLHAASGQIGAPATSLRVPAQTSPLAKCPPGSTAVRHGSDPSNVQCVAAPPCAVGMTRNTLTGECSCPPGHKSYRSGSDGVAKCVLAVSCPPGVSFDAVTGQCQCPPGTRLFRDGSGSGGCVP